VWSGVYAALFRWNETGRAKKRSLSGAKGVFPVIFQVRYYLAGNGAFTWGIRARWGLGVMAPNVETAAKPQPDARRPRPFIEFPTLALLIANYAAWLAVTAAYPRWPLAVVAPLTIALLVLHSSVQHEITHGHPTLSRRFNRWLGLPGLSLWLPYERYRQQHHAHHIDARLTDPLDDPESFYWRAEDLARLNAVSRASLTVQQTLAGRVLLGSFWRIGMFLRDEVRLLWADAPGVRTAWAEHLLWCVPVVLWLKLFCGMPLWIYVLTMVIPANGVQLIRAFAEHRAAASVPGRIALVERSWILGPLFLFNNLHLLHHESPAIPWYELPQQYARMRARLIAANGGLVYRDYFEVARRYLFRAHDALAHPTERVPAQRP
jgi:fatty acid desaturase